MRYANTPNALRAVREYAGSLSTPTHDELRAMMRARSEAIWQQAFADVLQQRPGSVRAAVAVLQRQALLDGLDVPRRVWRSARPRNSSRTWFRLLSAPGVTRL